MFRAKKQKVTTLIITLAVFCSTTNAQQRFHYRPYKVIPVVINTNSTSYVNNFFTQKERLAMAVAYLKKHKYLTINQYAKITKLSKTSAEYELDSFVMDNKKPIQFVIRKKKKIYVYKEK